jgi:hypothetical protein
MVNSRWDAEAISVQTPNKDVLTVGFLMAGFAWTICDYEP